MQRRYKPIYIVGTEPCRLLAGIRKETGLVVPSVCRSGIWYTRLEGQDARKLKKMFNMENCFVEVNPGHMLLPSKYEELADRIRTMEVRPSDVWVVSYPRTGD
jgi:(2Fe-2S) ferredoxin